MESSALDWTTLVPYSGNFTYVDNKNQCYCEYVRIFWQAHTFSPCSAMPLQMEDIEVFVVIFYVAYTKLQFTMEIQSLNGTSSRSRVVTMAQLSCFVQTFAICE